MNRTSETHREITRKAETKTKNKSNINKKNTQQKKEE